MMKMETEKIQYLSDKQIYYALPLWNSQTVDWLANLWNLTSQCLLNLQLLEVVCEKVVILNLKIETLI